MKLQNLAILIMTLIVVSACSVAQPAAETTLSPTAAPATEPATSSTPAEAELGAGFRFSTYGVPTNPGTQYWADIGQEMAAKFSAAGPEYIWIVGNFGGKGPTFTFPGKHEDFNIHFSAEDENEAALATFDQLGYRVWLQVEPGDIPVEELFRIILERYGHHPCVIGLGVDVEWFHSDGAPEGQAVSDEEAQSWVEAARAHNPSYRVFLKHWKVEKMPPTYREGLMFVDDSQELGSLAAMLDEFAAWGQAFSPSPVGFQYGYDADRAWWKELEDPAKQIGEGILARVPNTRGLYWVDFTALEVFPPKQ